MDSSKPRTPRKKKEMKLLEGQQKITDFFESDHEKNLSNKLRTLDLNADEKSVTKSLESMHLTPIKTRNLT